MAAEGGVIITYIFTGEEERDRTTGRYIIPQNITHLLFHESVTVIPARLFYKHPNIVEVICHVGVKRIEGNAFLWCPRLKRVIIPGVEVVESAAFNGCEAVTDIQCPKLERIEAEAFYKCKSLGSIDLLSAKIVDGYAFVDCSAMMDVKFGKNLESIGRLVFRNCPSLERITIPLKNGLFTYDNTFQACDRLRHVDLVEGAVLRETADALLLEEWKNDMNAVIDSIDQILANARSGTDLFRGNDEGEKSLAIRDWIGRVLRKIVDYKAQHRLLSDEAATILQLVLPNDIVMNNVTPFLDSPSYKFEGEEED